MCQLLFRTSPVFLFRTFFPICVAVVFPALGAFAQPVIPLEDREYIHHIGRQTLYFREPGNLRVEDLLQAGALARFRPYLQDVPNFSSTTDAVWFLFQVRQKTAGDFFLQIGSAFMDSVSLYAVRDGKVVSAETQGDDLPFNKRNVKVTTYLFKLQPPPGEPQTYLLRVKSLQPLFFPLRVATLQTFMEDTHVLDFVQGIYIGFMLLIFLYNLFLFFSTREPNYLYYVAYVLSITLFMVFVFQYGFEFLWPNQPFINRYAVASSAATMVTAVLFTRQFLHTRSNAPRLHRFSAVFLVVAALITALLFSPFKIEALMLAQGGIMLMALYFLVTGVAAWRSGFEPAKYYLIAWIFLILGFVAAILESLNILPVMYYINSMQIGSAIEVTLLSFALAYKINLYKKQREEAQLAALAAEKEKSELIQRQNVLLEEKVEERTSELKRTLELVEREKEKSDRLLLNILPYATAQELKETGKFTPHSYNSVSVMFADVKGFTHIAELLSAEELVTELDKIFKGLDEIVKRYGLEKIKTIGDAYMAAGGLPVENSSHPIDTIRAAFDIQEFMRRNPIEKGGQLWQLRVGIHTGPVTAGVVGKDKFAYDIWGDAVNVAARMESNSEPGRINISESTYSLVKPHVKCVPRGQLQVKNHGKVEMYFVDAIY